MNIEEAVHTIVARCRENDAGGTEQAGIMALAEETGEFVGAMRRWRGLARRRGTEQEAQAELADVIISAYAMAEVMGWDASALVGAKLEKIMSRGWKELVDVDRPDFRPSQGAEPLQTGEPMHYWPTGGKGFACDTDAGFRTSHQGSVTCPDCRGTFRPSDGPSGYSVHARPPLPAMTPQQERAEIAARYCGCGSPEAHGA
jgi:NTP pyrophosphatase (non-canonical NTP hydrolase)